MDSVDKGLLMDLTKNCRITFESLAQKYNLSPNAIRRRVLNLIETGVIEEFTVYLSPAMVGTEHIYALLSTDGSRGDDLIDEIGEHPNILLAGFLSTDTCSVYADYTDNADLAKVLTYLRNREGVTEVRVHHLLIEHGERIAFKKMDLKVLACLYEDPRMSAAEISSRTGIATKRVRRLLSELSEGAALYFTIRWNPNAADAAAFMSEIEYNESDTSAQGVLDELEKQYPTELCREFCWISATEPTLFAVFLVDHLRRAEHITHEIRKNPSIASISTLLPYPTKKYDGLRRQRLREMLEGANLL
ncbi:MAG: winged helix-turn-helix transcriptional regulator [Candidatus Thorarchaeota archaeon]|nr:winged helix-turn-helix transcriptional regulator [Candidatus Thorarchaeota archaeon]